MPGRTVPSPVPIERKACGGDAVRHTQPLLLKGGEVDVVLAPDGEAEALDEIVKKL